MQSKKPANSLKPQVDKTQNSALSNLPKQQQKGKRLKGFPMHKNLFSKLLRIKQATNKKPHTFAHQDHSDGAEKCYDRQDLHLLHLKEIMSEKNMPKRKVWNVRLPKAEFKRLLQSENTGRGPISHRLSVSVYPEKEENEWDQVQEHYKEREYVLTRIASIYPKD